MEDQKPSPLRVALSCMVNKKPPKYLEGMYSISELDEEQYVELQEFCHNFGNPWWSTGIGIMEAADHIVSEAVKDDYIYPKEVE